MTTKDRLASFKAKQSDNTNNIDCVLNMTDPTMDAFFTSVRSVKAMTDEIRANIQQIKQVHTIILTSPNAEQDKQRLESLMDDTDRTVNRVRQELKKLKMLEKENLERTSPANSRIRSTQLSSLSTIFFELMTECNRLKDDYRERSKGRLRRQMQIMGTQATDEELDQMLEHGSVAIFTQDILAETRQAKLILADAEARHDDIINLGKSIKELYDLFVDMAALVENQGECVNRIEVRVSETKDSVNKGKDELEKAEIQKRRAFRKKVAIAICILIIVVILIAIVLAAVNS